MLTKSRRPLARLVRKRAAPQRQARALGLAALAAIRAHWFAYSHSVTACGVTSQQTNLGPLPRSARSRRYRLRV